MGAKTGGGKAKKKTAKKAVKKAAVVRRAGKTTKVKPGALGAAKTRPRRTK